MIGDDWRAGHRPRFGAKFRLVSPAHMAVFVRPHCLVGHPKATPASTWDGYTPKIDIDDNSADFYRCAKKYHF